MTIQLLEEKVDTYSTNNNHLNPVDCALLTPEQRSFLIRLESFEAPYLEEKLLKENKFTNNWEYQEAFTEFKKYVALSAFFGKGHGMASEKVDDIWHQFILFTPQYHEFCKEFLGRYMHHNPKTSYTPLEKESTKNLVKHYKLVFGNMPLNVWNELKNVISNADCGDCCESCNCDSD